jgi:hypothetical protein
LRRVLPLKTGKAVLHTMVRGEFARKGVTLRGKSLS